MPTLIQTQIQNIKRRIKITVAITVAIAVVSGYLGYQSWSLQQTLKAQTQTNLSLAADFDKQYNDLETEYTDKKTQFINRTTERAGKITNILPAEEALTDLTRTIDTFFVDNNFANDPILLTSLTFGSITEHENYNSVRMTLTIESSENNFYKLLKFINNSGNINTPYRLMSVVDIALTFNDTQAETTSGPTIVSYTIQADAFFQK